MTQPTAFPFPTGDAMRAMREPDSAISQLDPLSLPEVEAAGTWEHIGNSEDEITLTSDAGGEEVRLQYGCNGRYVEKEMFLCGEFLFVADDNFFSVRPGDLDEGKTREVWLFHPTPVEEPTTTTEQEAVLPELPGLALFDLVSLFYMTQNLDLRLQVVADETGFKSMTITKE